MRFQHAVGFKSLGCSHTHLQWPVINAMFHILYSHDSVLKQAATLILFSCNVIPFSEVSTSVPMLRKTNIYIYVISQVTLGTDLIKTERLLNVENCTRFRCDN